LRYNYYHLAHKHGSTYFLNITDRVTIRTDLFASVRFVFMMTRLGSVFSCDGSIHVNKMYLI
jgi:hypothetical protein